MNIPYFKTFAPLLRKLAGDHGAKRCFLEDATGGGMIDRL